MFKHAILMDASFMGKCIFPNDRLVELDGESSCIGNQSTQVGDFSGIDIGLVGHDVIAHPGGHNDFLQSCITGPLTKTIDRAFHLPCSGIDCCQGIRYCHAKIVMTMG